MLSVSGFHMVAVPRPQNSFPQVMPQTVERNAPSVAAMPFYPKKMHEWAGYLFIGAGVIHLVLNQKFMLSYLRFKREKAGH